MNTWKNLNAHDKNKKKREKCHVAGPAEGTHEKKKPARPTNTWKNLNAHEQNKRRVRTTKTIITVKISKHTNKQTFKTHIKQTMRTPVAFMLV